MKSDSIRKLKVISHFNLAVFNSLIEDHLEDDWEIHGEMQMVLIGGSSNFFQTVVKFESKWNAYTYYRGISREVADIKNDISLIKKYMHSLKKAKTNEKDN